MPPPPPKMLKPLFPEKEQQIEQLLTDCGYLETLEVFRAERNKRCRTSSLSEPSESTNLIEKKGDLWCCTFCDKTFTTKGSAKRHLVSTHSTDSKQFECPKCSSKFARRDDLYTHLRRMHSAGQLVEAMIEEHKAELKGEHKGFGRGKLFSVISHNEHLDVILPSGNTICRPFATDVSSSVAKEPVRAAKACRAAKCHHWRVMHDDHEDVLVNGALHHKNEEGEWECHGEIGSLEDFEFLLTHSQPIMGDAPIVQVNSHHHHHGHGEDCNIVHSVTELNHVQHDSNDLSFDDLDFFLSGQESDPPVKNSVESLLLPGGSVLCRRVSSGMPKYHYLHPWASEEHKHSINCGHTRMRHGSHYDYLVGNLVESDLSECPMNGATVLESTDTEQLAQVVSALASEAIQQHQNEDSSGSTDSD